MDGPNPNFQMESRKDLRKRKTMNRVLNISIGVVVVLIAFFLYALLFGDDGEPVADEDAVEEDNVEDDESEQDEDGFEVDSDQEAPAPEETPDIGGNEEDEENEGVNDDQNGTESEEGDEGINDGQNGTEPEEGDEEEEGQEEEQEEEQEESTGLSPPQSPPEDGDFEPIGTEQENFVDNFDSDSQNWTEMVMAMEYATGVPEEDWSHIEWLGGDGPGGAEGTFQHEDGSEYTVTMEWVDGEGWMPTNVE
ncbi:type IV secretory pathway VirB10-like protein [Geomicrobium halophilum]|uniref:Type IV secretory pathway VirB10-like protein n=1 Tax=Geomicrobium halophilum TaxID=549000 RepID=A0A841PX90_9BACL|nr:DUF1510 family protein [Geomicrobium halophilum]MBB6448575.1 type IV secretory pathway VirB10-like protein [Geomicrobium halophilum]